MKKSVLPISISAIIIVIVSVSLAFASQSDDPSNGGIGRGQVSGVTVTGIDYQLLPENPSMVNAVKLEVMDFDGFLSISLDADSGKYFPCENISKGLWSCPVNNIGLADINVVNVVAKGR